MVIPAFDHAKLLRKRTKHGNPNTRMCAPTQPLAHPNLPAHTSKGEETYLFLALFMLLAARASIDIKVWVPNQMVGCIGP